MGTSSEDLPGIQILKPDPGRKCKLSVFPFNHFGTAMDEDLFLTRDEFPAVSVGDVVEIFNPDPEFDNNRPRLLLKVGPKSIYPDNRMSKPLNKETIYIEKSIAENFHLQNFKDVLVRKVDPSLVALDSVELTFKEQYMGRSEMWRVKNGLLGCCVVINKKIEYAQGTIRCQVSEMWAQGNRVACGVVTSDTKVVFRSPTAMIYLFIQMSSEMWDFDKYGDLYFEKAVEGFLTDMFDKWKKFGSSHEVTIVLFTRCFYDAVDRCQFPEKMQDCIQTGYNGQFYEDFYRVVVQNERFDDWKPTLLQLRRLFTDYKSSIVNYHKTGNPEKDNGIPEATISTASKGNFLEVLNMSLNTFENHYLNRNLDRTGQQSIVITPGLGLFEVDRELMLITKQRIIDSGVGSDLICVGEQPLHAVPLFQLHSKDSVEGTGGSDDYSMPHWINLSFYNKQKRSSFRHPTFVPRVKLPPEVDEVIPDSVNLLTDKYFPRGTPLPAPDPEYAKDPLKYFEDYDSKIFSGLSPNKRPNRGASSAGILRATSNTVDLLASSLSISGLQRKLSDPEARIGRGGADSPTHILFNGDRSVGIPRNESTLTFIEDGLFSTSGGTLLTTSNHPTTQMDISLMEDKEESGLVDPSLMGSIDTSFDHQAIKKYLLRPGRALINPFDPSHTEIRLTSNRRRWTHIFPKSSSNNISDFTFRNSESVDVLSQISEVRTLNFHHDDVDDNGDVTYAPQTTGVDWKSLTIPASLPITTDYFPKKRSLVNDYLVNEYDLTPEEIWLDSTRSPLEKVQLNNEEVFSELVSQRLAQGFQLILSQDGNEPFTKTPTSGSVMPRSPEESNSVWLSIGRIYHRITLSADKKQIKVTCYRPRHPYPSIAVHYRYRFAAPDNDDYEVSWVEFKTEQLENFNWNRMDFYVCTRGDKEFILTESLKYWRFRIYAVPLNQFQPYTKKILDGTSKHGNIYNVRLVDEQTEMTEKFLRFVETCLNRLKRPLPVTSKKHQQHPPIERPRAFTSQISGTQLQKMKTDISTSLGVTHAGAGPLLSPPPREISLSSSNVSNDGSSYESPSSFAASGTVPTESGSDSNSEHRNTLKTTSSINEILGPILKTIFADAMRATQSGGLTFFNKTAGLPPLTFIAYEAVVWIMERVEDVSRVENATKLLQNMLDKKFICHASGNEAFPFHNGHHLYYIVQPNAPKQERPMYCGDLETFQNDWLEIDVDTARFTSKSSPNLMSDDMPEFLDRTMDRFREREEMFQKIASSPFYKCATIDVDQNARSERTEWGHLKYQPRYDPQSAFEVTLQWSVATGSIITDLIYGWARKSQLSGFSLIPVPHDPFALPITKNSDPVRGPIFVELNTESLMENRSFLFEQFPEATWEKRMLLFREEIALRFGFVSCITNRGIKRSSSSLFSTDHQYIHCTGNMFLLIPTQVQLQTGIQGFKIKPSTTGTDLAVSRGANKPDSKEPKKHSKVNRSLMNAKPAYDHSETGFLWSWNFMISKRWKQISNTGATGDIPFMDKMLSDFRSFCRNDDNRLRNFWDECWAKKAAHDTHHETSEE